MSAWGNNDDVTSVGTVDLSGLTVSNSAGQECFFANNLSVGQVMTITGAGSAVISSITDETTLTLVSNTEIDVGSITGAAYTVSEKPKYVVDSDTNIFANNVFGVDTTEAGFQIFRVSTVAIANSGAGFSNTDIIQVSGGTGSQANVSVTTNDQGVPANVALVTAGRYTVAPTLVNNIPSNFLGRGLRLTLTLADTVGANVTHAGWVHKIPTYTDANGNVRKKSEVLVAMSTITGDAADDGELPES